MTSPATARTAALRVPPWNFADKTRKIRRDVLKIEQAEFAQQLNVSRQRYAAWESGRTQPRDMVALAKRIELLSGVPAAWILGVESGPDDDPGGRGNTPGTDPETVVFPTASSTLDDVAAQVIAMPERNGAVATINGSPAPHGTRVCTGVTRMSYARTVNRAVAA